MLHLLNIDFKTFEKEIYPKYLGLFPSFERKHLSIFKSTYNSRFTSFIKIIDNNTTVVFLLIQ